MNILSITKKILSNYRPPALTKWQEVYNIMSVHTQGALPIQIFKDRRPLESENKQAFKFRSNNYRAITKNEFDKAIADYTTTALNLDVVVEYGSNDDLKAYEDTLKLNNTYTSFSLKEWIIKRVGWYKQTDPNAVVVVLPKHISETFVPNYLFDLPDFNNIINQKIDIDIRLIGYADIVDISNDYLVFKGGDYQVNDSKSYPYYFGIDKEQTILFIPKLADNKLSYKSHIYYNNNLTNAPFYVIGSRYVLDADGTEYFISDYHGAAGWGDLAIGQGSDLRICEIRFVYPRHWRVKVPCDNVMVGGCHLDTSLNRHVTSDGHTCGRCSGTGYIMDTTPTGTLMVSKGGDFLDEQGKFTVPEGFITPDTLILQHSANREAYYFDMMLNALCVSKQNMTNQSGESKRYDSQQRVDLVSGILFDLFKLYENILNSIAEYRGGSNDVNISLPEDLDIKNSADYIVEIAQAKSSGSPYVILVELTKKYLLKNFGASAKNEFVINELAKIDKIFAYGSSELVQAKASLGSDLTNEDIILHHQGFQIMIDLFNEGKITKDSSTDEINAIVRKVINETFNLSKHIISLEDE